jgi:hypothetical protein
MTDLMLIDKLPAAEADDALSSHAALMQVIARAAANPAVDVERMQALLAMHERVTARDAERQFNVAMKEAQAAMPRLVKDARGETSKYLTLEKIGTVIDPIARAHGFSASFGTADSPLDGHYRVTCHLSHDAGHTRLYHADIQIDTKGPKGNQNKTATQGFGSTMSYGRRYLKALIYDLVIVGEDNDGARTGNGVGCLTPDQVKTIEELLHSTGRSLDRFLKFKRIDALARIRSDDYRATIAQIQTVAARDTASMEAS